MRTLTPLLMVAALGAAMVMSAGSAYELAARQEVINRSPAAEVIKADATQQAMFETQDRPTMPPGMTLVFPWDRGRV